MQIIPYFTNIEAQVLNQIARAEQSIYIAVAWFTNTRIMNGLIERMENCPGMCIQIVVDDNDTNRLYFMNRSQALTDAGIIIKGKANGRFLHHKFLVIDQQRVMYGSYNFTGKAKRNAENFCLVEDTLVAKHFVKEFHMLTDATYIDENLQLLLCYPQFAQQFISANYPFSSKDLKKYHSRIAVGHCFLADNGYYDDLHYEPGFIFNPICQPFKDGFPLPDGKRLLEDWHTNLVMRFGREYYNDYPQDIDGLSAYMNQNLQALTEYYKRKFENLYPLDVLEEKILANVNIIIETQLWTVNFAPFFNPHALDVLMNALPDRSNDEDRRKDSKLIKRLTRTKQKTNDYEDPNSQIPNNS